MSLTRYAKKLAMERKKLLIKTYSHAQARRAERIFGELEWFGPAALGSKTNLYFVIDTLENRDKLARFK